MDISSQRRILRVGPTSEISQLAGEITSALVGVGPCLGFGQITSEFAPTNTAVVVGTSGSSGDSKEVALSAAALIASARASNTFIGAKAGDTWSLLLPLTHIAAVNVIVRSMELGTLPIDLKEFKDEYPKVNFTAIVPTQLFRALNGDDRLLRHLQNADAVLVGGAALSPGLRHQAESQLIKIITTYGMTESCGGCVYDGEALTGVEIKIVHGKINLRGTVLASSYLNSSWDLDVGWFETSDLGEIIAGKLVVYGRADDVIISGGENISLSAIENALTQEFPQLQCAAFSIEDPQWGQVLQLAIVGDFDSEKVFQVLETSLGSIAKPKNIYRVNSLPLLGIGKIDRKTLAKEISFE
jgi:O-succinylbenzoic acid--CoA ligase